MRILVVANLYPSPARPGWGTFVATRVDALRAEGHQVALVSPGSGPAWRRYLGLLARATGVTALRALAGSRRTDVVEAHIGYPTGLLARPMAALLRAPLVLFAHGADVLSLPDRSRLDAVLSRRLFRRADLVVSNGPVLSAALRRRVGEPRRLVEVSPGIDLTLFEGGPPREPHDRPRLLFAGHLIERKGVDVLLRALVLRPDRFRTVTVCGDGPQRAGWTALAAELGLNIEWRGEVTPAEIGRAMCAADVLAVPTLRDEALGLVALEGMAAGCVVVASRVDGLAVTVDDGRNGLLAEPGDVADLSRALDRAIEMLGEPSALRALRQAARATAEANSVRESVRSTVAEYAALMDGPA
ncbi:MAG: glycosyltransferase family 4 protein [Pseudonocardiales bacterium]